MAKQSSSASNSRQSRLLLTKPEELKIGMYVDLNCSWFKHPFASKTFKIASEDELTIIRSLGLSSVLVDPALSDREKPQWNEDEPETEKNQAVVSSSVSAEPALDSDHPRPTFARYKESLGSSRRGLQTELRSEHESTPRSSIRIRSRRHYGKGNGQCAG